MSRRILFILLLTTFYFSSYSQNFANRKWIGKGKPTLKELAKYKLRVTDSLNQLGVVFPAQPNYNAKVMGAPESDCKNAIPVCQQTYSQTNSYPDYGNIQDLPDPDGCGSGNGLCLLNREQKTVWYTFTVQNAGTFGFTINTTYDYDFALYDVTGYPNLGCDAIRNGTLTSIRCNYSADYGTTGLDPSSTTPYTTSVCSTAADGPMMPGLNVVPGRTYVLVVDNWTGDNTGYTITFNGTAQIFDNTPPTITSSSIVCNGDPVTITVNFDEFLDCSTISASNFSISSNPGGWSIASVTPVGCSSNSYTDQVEITLNAGTGSGSLSLQVSGIQDKCGNTMANTTLSFNVVGNFTISASPTPICNGDNSTITGPSMPAGYSYTWSTGATSQNITVSPTSTTGYTLTVTAPSSGCKRDATTTVEVSSPPVITVDPPSQIVCSYPGGSATVDVQVNGAPCTDCTIKWQDLGSPSCTNCSNNTRNNFPSAGNYTVEVWRVIGGQNVCYTSASISISQPTGNSACDIIFVSPTGATSPGAGISPSNPAALQWAINT